STGAMVGGMVAGALIQGMLRGGGRGGGFGGGMGGGFGGGGFGGGGMGGGFGGGGFGGGGAGGRVCGEDRPGSPAAQLASAAMTRRLRALIAAAAVITLLAAAVVTAAAWYRPMLLTGTGYAAHNACALHFLVGREDYASDLPPNPLVPVLRTTVDEGDGTATASVLGIAFRQTAHLPGHGCALGDRAAGPRDGAPPPPSPAENPRGVRLPEAADAPA